MSRSTATCRIRAASKPLTASMTLRYGSAARFIGLHDGSRYRGDEGFGGLGRGAGGSYHAVFSASKQGRAGPRPGRELPISPHDSSTPWQRSCVAALHLGTRPGPGRALSLQAHWIQWVVGCEPRAGGPAGEPRRLQLAASGGGTACALKRSSATSAWASSFSSPW